MKLVTSWEIGNSFPSLTSRLEYSAEINHECQTFSNLLPYKIFFNVLINFIEIKNVLMKSLVYDISLLYTDFLGLVSSSWLVSGNLRRIENLGILFGLLLDGCHITRKLLVIFIIFYFTRSKYRNKKVHSSYL